MYVGVFGKMLYLVVVMLLLLVVVVVLMRLMLVVVVVLLRLWCVCHVTCHMWVAAESKQTWGPTVLT